TAATAVKPRAGKVMQIRQAIELQLPGASRWLSLLQDAMPDIRFELLSPSTQAFFDMAQWIRDKGIRLWLVSSALGVGVCLSFPYMDNALRRWLDKWGPYRLYRDVQAIAVVSTAATAVKPRAGKVMQIRQAIELQLPGASRWLS
ncbi:hypothetical protein CTI14_39795, partial [Methylobacterium radiotolerans]